MRPCLIGERAPEWTPVVVCAVNDQCQGPVLATAPGCEHDEQIRVAGQPEFVPSATR